MITPKYIEKNRRRNRIRKTIRKKLSGTPSTPRMIVVKSNKYLYAQVIDDENNLILASASTLEKELRSKLKSTKDKEAAKLMGKIIADRMKDKKIKEIVFDRNLYPYMGCVKVFADSTRENGIKF